MRTICGVAGIIVLLGLSAAFVSCTGGHFVTTNVVRLSAADSLFLAGDFVHAKMAFTDIIDKYPKSEAAEDAQYTLGYINVFYANPFGDWEAALRDFTKYQVEYPEGRHIDEANTWINILHTLQSYGDGYSSSTNQARDLLTKHSSELKKATTLTDALLRCDAVKDSLTKEIEIYKIKMKDREDLILKLQ